MRAFRVTGIVLARFLLSAIFLTAGIHKIFYWHEGEVALLNVLSEWQVHLESFPSVQEFLSFLTSWTPLLLLGATLFELVGGLLLLLGVREKLGAGLLVLFLIPTTVLFHQFWFLDGSMRELQQTMFLKNLAIIGGLMMVLLNGAQPFGKDNAAAFKF